MTDKGIMGFSTKATELEKKYEESLSRVDKKKEDWVELGNHLASFLHEIKSIKTDPLTGLPMYGIRQTLVTQGLITELGTSLSDIESRLVKLEKTVSNLSLKIS